jgi:hypothetical protein
VVERPGDRRLRWARSVAGMLIHGVVGRWGEGRRSKTALGGVPEEAGLDDVGDEVEPTRDVPRRRQ